MLSVSGSRYMNPTRSRRLLWAAVGILALSACSVSPPRAELTEVAAQPPQAAPVVTAPQPPMPAPASLAHAPDVWQRFARERHWQQCVLTPGVERWIKRVPRSCSSLASWRDTTDFPQPSAIAALLMLPAWTMALKTARRWGFMKAFSLD